MTVHRSIALCTLTLMCLGSIDALGQIRPRGPAKVPAGGATERPATSSNRKRTSTVISVDLLTGEEGNGLRAQRWMQLFDKLDVTLTIRRQTPQDKPGVTEKKTTETVRHVQIVGKLDNRGRLVFDDRVYTEADADKLAEWFKELREYGSQGTPEKQPLWGLTKQQFGVIHEALCHPLAEDPKDKPLREAIKLVQLPATLPLRVSESAEMHLRELGDVKVGQSLTEISEGTALAALLAEYGLGFRPRRLPGGEVELSIVPQSEDKTIWPVGWTGDKPNPALAPKLFSFVPIELEDIELDAVLEAASGVIAVPILTDRASLAKKEIDFSKIKVSHPSKRTTWGLALNKLLGQAKTKSELLIDETGRPFLWVTPMDVPRRAKPE